MHEQVDFKAWRLSALQMSFPLPSKLTRLCFALRKERDVLAKPKQGEVALYSERVRESHR